MIWLRLKPLFLFDNSTPTTVSRQVKMQGVGWCHVAMSFFVIYGDAVSVDSILKELHFTWLLQKIEADGKNLWIAACDGTYKPFLALSSCHNKMVARLG